MGWFLVRLTVHELGRHSHGALFFVACLCLWANGDIVLKKTSVSENDAYRVEHWTSILPHTDMMKFSSSRSPIGFASFLQFWFR